MDNTTLTIYGMIAAFLTASITPILTESVKHYLQHKTRLRSLRTALYKEMLSNHKNLVGIGIDPEKGKISESMQAMVFLSQHFIRAECYKQALQNELPLYYELKEAERINVLQGAILGGLLEITKTLSGKRYSKKTLVQLAAFSQTYQDLFTTGFYTKEWDNKTMRSLMSAEEYQRLVAKGSEHKQPATLIP